MIAKGIVKDFGELISKAERRTIKGIEDGRVETEPSVTDRFLNELERISERQGEKGNIVFRARTLRGRGPNAPEHRFGADFCGVLDIRFRDFKQTKGFLSQAKMEKGGIFVQKGFKGATTVSFSYSNDLERLKEQVDKMLLVTPDSFTIIYSSNGFVVIPACSIKGLDKGGKLYAKPVARFFKEYLMCFIGDPRLKAYDDRSLESLRRETNARTAIIFQIHEGGS